VYCMWVKSVKRQLAKRGVRLRGRLTHGEVAKLYEISERHGYPWLIAVTGETIGIVLAREGKRPSCWVRYYFKAICNRASGDTT